MTFIYHRFNNRFAFGAGIYIGTWGIHLYFDIGPFCLGFEYQPKERGTK